ncbi:MAG: sulfotransferase family 2 domain-containing protein [Nocardioides sp.]
MFRRDDKRILFVHVPKTGGTSVERLFKESGWRVTYLDRRVGPESDNWMRRCSPQHMHAEMLRLMFHLDRFDLVFMTVREPLARFRSEYSMRHRDDLRTDSELVDAWAERTFRKYQANPFRHDNHVRPQSEFLVPGAVVYKLEDGLDRMVADLRERFGLEVASTVPHDNARVKKSGLPSEQVQISPETEKRVREFYEADYAQFGY